MRTPVPFVLGALTLVAGSGCQFTTANPDHCSNNGGDKYCRDKFPEMPYCADGNNPDCSNDKYGCREELPTPQCHDECGSSNCVAGTDTDTSETASTMGSSGPTTTGATMGSSGPTTTSTSGPTSTTGPAACTDGSDCEDTPATPFCEAPMCVACNRTGDDQNAWDTACAGLSEATPLCETSTIIGTCVACTDEDIGACGDLTPICDTDTNSCVGCTDHRQCASLACHLDPSSTEFGACFDGPPVSAPTPNDLVTTINGVEAGDDIVIDLTGSNYSLGAPISLAVEAEVAIIGDGTQRISGVNLNGIIQTGGQSILYVDGAILGGNPSGDILDCAGAALWLDRSTVQSADNVGLDISSECQAHVRTTILFDNLADAISVDGNAASLELVNSFAWGANDQVVIDAADADVEVLYSTIGANFGNSTGIRCLGSASATVRNSIIVSRSADAVLDCATLSVDSSALETDQAGSGNDNVGDVDVGWFTDYNNANFHLADGHPFSDTATWQDGDPLADIDGQARIELDGQMEIPGADLP